MQTQHQMRTREYRISVDIAIVQEVTKFQTRPRLCASTDTANAETRSRRFNLFFNRSLPEITLSVST